jgi:2,4-didehydro-3-deoxy-L-rhamnonate hydrolase
VDEAGDPARAMLITRLNGAAVQRSGVDRMLSRVQRILSWLSATMPRLPGDVIATALPQGSGSHRAGLSRATAWLWRSRR